MTSLPRLFWAAVVQAWNHRILGLAAEAAFWQLVALPSAILAILGTIGFFSGALGHENLVHLQRSIDNATSHVIVPSAVKSTIDPALQNILFNGRADVVSISFVVSIWTGSSAMATYVNTITIAYGLRSMRGPVSSRLLALRLYVAFVLTSIILIPVLVLGPGKFVRLFPDKWHHTVNTATEIAYWPVVTLVSLALLATLYHRAVPVRTPWRRALPGAVVAVVIWLTSSIILRSWLIFAFRRTSAYGPLSAPVAVLLFLYFLALAILYGAELNAQIDRIWPRPETDGLREDEAVTD